MKIITSFEKRALVAIIALSFIICINGFKLTTKSMKTNLKAKEFGKISTSEESYRMARIGQLPNTFTNFSPNDFVNTLKQVSSPGMQRQTPDKGGRSYQQILLTGYYRLKDFMERVSDLIKDAYVLNVQLKYTKGSASKFIFGLKMSSPTGVSKSGSNIEQYPLIKVCVPADRLQPSYISFKCVFNECPSTFEQQETCKNEGKNVPIDTVGANGQLSMANGKREDTNQLIKQMEEMNANTANPNQQGQNPNQQPPQPQQFQ